MVRAEATKQYGHAQRLGQRYFKTRVGQGQYPYLPVLNEIFSENMTAGHVTIGLVEIPTEMIVGTVTSGRRNAFAGNFMPLLGEGTEFAGKWISLCEAHLGDEGIVSPISCYEYMGQFYVLEGNKRVSVLKSYDAPSIRGTVTRIVPSWSEDESVRVYYEFMDFYQLSGLYDISFTALGSYKTLQAKLGFEADHVWTDEEKSEFLYGFRRFKEAFSRVNTEQLAITPGDALLVWLQINPVEDLQQTDLVKSLTAVWPDVRIFANGRAIALSTSPREEDKGILPRILGIGRVNHLNVAFIYAFDPARSGWSAAHDAGRKQLEEVMGDRITVKTYLCESGDPLDTMETAVAEGAQVLFATTPPMIDACRQIAARYPQLKVLNCSLSMPYAGVRTYYSRIFEGKFITGAIAGAMATEDRIGYVANYPIIGTVTAINAFALGARLTNPRATIELRWSCVPGNPIRSLLDAGVSVISNRDSGIHEPHWAWEWGTYKVEADGNLQPLASPCWNWGKFYEGVVRSVFDGSWNTLNAKGTEKAVNYWWGMNSGVIDVSISPSLPEGVRQLAQILKQGVVDRNINVFGSKLVDQQGNVRSNGDRALPPEEILYMDWLLDNVNGSIPEFEDLLPVSQQLVRLLGVRSSQVKAQPEEVNP